MTHRERVLKQLADGGWYTRVDLGIECGSVRLLYGMAHDNQIRCRKSKSHPNGGNQAWQFALGEPRTAEERRCREHMVSCLQKSRDRRRRRENDPSVEAKERHHAEPKAREIGEMNLDQHVALMYATAGRKAPRVAN